MSNANKPTFLLTKGQRNEERLDTWSIDEHYRQVFSGLHIWDGMPDMCPKDFIENTALWFKPGVGAKKVRGFGNIIAPAEASNLTIYGVPYDWIPSPISGMQPMNLADPYFQPSNEPLLWFGISMYSQIEPYIQIMNQTLKVLNTNVIGLSQPIMISGLPSAPMKGLILKSELMDGETYIPITSRDGIAPEVLDLKATDHTQNLISTLDWCDARILEIMMSSNGVEKASGITTMETVSGVQSIMQEFEIGLEKRREWADTVNDRLRMDISVRPGKGIDALMARPAQSNGNGPTSEDDGSEVSEDA